MGMAAGQARLLSITSRMSDNELRAQIINNNKIRLATESSQVSEAYVTALNEAQLMFTNYDADNNASYQKLTFNAMTAYNPYNNQYILTNNSGNVLLSETDAVNYKNANGDVTKFLKSYGLENTTTYWDNLATHYDSDKGGIEYKTDLTDDNGNPLYGYINANPTTTDADAITKYIQKLYEGNLDTTYTNASDETVKLHPGYMEAVSSEDYYNYHSKLAAFETAYDEYLETIASNMSNYLETKIKATGGGQSNKTLDEIKTGLNNADTTINDASKWLECLSNFIDQAETLKLQDNTTANNYFKNLHELLNNNKGTKMTEIVSNAGDDKKDGYHVAGDVLTVYDEDGKEMWSLTRNGIPGTYTYTFSSVAGKDDNKTSLDSFTITATTDSSNNTIVCTPTNGTMQGCSIKVPTTIFASSNNNISVETDNTLGNMQAIGNSIITSLKNSIYTVWDPNNAAFVPQSSDDYGWDEYKTYLEKGAELSEQIFGKDIGKENYPQLTDIEWTHKVLNGTTELTYKDDNGNNVQFDPENTKKDEDFQKIYDAYLLDMIMNTYGEPNYTWIDTSSPNDSYNVNGEAKAQWYENLFERIQSGGYKVLQDGLASSSEWIQFAFESGIVSMEQVDTNQNWQPLIYSNCSDITEQTDDTAITVAEAEYNAAMNKIENKDKRYDLELKNIDTEHNSLQTEYDSIKTAIDKNIERTFKLYS